MKQVMVRQQTYEGPDQVIVNIPNWLKNNSVSNNNNRPTTLPPTLPRKPTLTEENLENLETLNLSGPEWDIKVGNVESETMPSPLLPVPKTKRWWSFRRNRGRKTHNRKSRKTTRKSRLI